MVGVTQKHNPKKIVFKSLNIEKIENIKKRGKEKREKNIIIRRIYKKKESED